MTIEELDLCVRSFNCLKRAGINTVEDLINTSEDDMMKVRNLGEEVSGRSYLQVGGNGSVPCQERRLNNPNHDRGTRLLPGAPPG